MGDDQEVGGPPRDRPVGAGSMGAGSMGADELRRSTARLRDLDDVRAQVSALYAQVRQVREKLYTVGVCGRADGETSALLRAYRDAEALIDHVEGLRVLLRAPYPGDDPLPAHACTPDASVLATLAPVEGQLGSGLRFHCLQCHAVWVPGWDDDKEVLTWIMETGPVRRAE